MFLMFKFPNYLLYCITKYTKSECMYPQTLAYFLLVKINTGYFKVVANNLEKNNSNILEINKLKQYLPIITVLQL